MTFEYIQKITCEEHIDIEDVGNTCVQTFTDFGETTVLIIKTTMGITEVIQYGPVNVDVDELPDRVWYTYERFEYNQRKLGAIIQKFISNPNIIQVFEIEYEDAKKIIRGLLECSTAEKQSCLEKEISLDTLYQAQMEI